MTTRGILGATIVLAVLATVGTVIVIKAALTILMPVMIWLDGWK